MISKISLETPQLSKSPIEYAGTASAMKAAMVYAEDHGLRRGSINLMIQVTVRLLWLILNFHKSASRVVNDGFGFRLNKL